MTDEKLCEFAKEAMMKAYAPYSGCFVGAALLAKSGKVYTGCNIESCAYSPTNCAERSAFFTAVSQGEREFEKIAVVGGKKGVILDVFPPCGVCRQVMLEFCDPETFRILMVHRNGMKTRTLAELMPVAFGKTDYCGTKGSE